MATPRQGDKALCVPVKESHGEPSISFAPTQLTPADQFGQVGIALPVLGQKHQVISLLQGDLGTKDGT